VRYETTTAGDKERKSAGFFGRQTAYCKDSPDYGRALQDDDFIESDAGYDSQERARRAYPGSSSRQVRHCRYILIARP
jgi:hypothetical protein